MEIDDIDSADVVSIIEYFKDLDDPRSTINRKHRLGDLIVICILAVIAGTDGPKAIGVWADSHAEWLRRHFELPNGVPSHNTIGRLLAVLKPAAFQKCFEQWIISLRDEGDDSIEAGKETIAIDGKWYIRRGGALRRSHDRRRGLGPLFLVREIRRRCTGSPDPPWRAVRDHFDIQMENDFEGTAVRTHQEVVTGHGRVDTL